MESYEDIIKREKEMVPVLVKKLFTGEIEDLKDLRELEITYDTRQEVIEQYLKARYNPFDIKFGPGHFFKGTKFVVMTDRSKGVQIFTASHIYFRPGSGWGITCEETWDTLSQKDREELQIKNYKPTRHAFHIDHVRGIVSHPNKLITLQGEENERACSLARKDDIIRQRDLPYLREIALGSSDYRQEVSVFGLRDLVHRYIYSDGIKIKTGQIVDIERLLDSLSDQTWVKVVDKDSSFGYIPKIVIVDKKRLKKFIRSNLNRFLMSYKQADQIEKEIQEEIYRREMEFDEWK